MLGISINLLIVLLVVISLLLLAVVLMQRPKNEGLGAAFGAALTDQAFGARTTDVLKKATVYFGTAFLIICLILSMLMNREEARNSESMITNAPQNAAPAAPAADVTPAAPAADVAPAAPATETAPAAPATPAAPAPAEAQK